RGPRRLAQIDACIPSADETADRRVFYAENENCSGPMLHPSPAALGARGVQISLRSDLLTAALRRGGILGQDAVGVLIGGVRRGPTGGQPALGQDLRAEVIGHGRVLAQELLRLLATLDLRVADREERPALLDEPIFHRHVDQVALPADSLVE